MTHISQLVGMWERSFSKNETLTHQGQAVSDIGILTDGVLMEEKYHLDGRRQILRVFMPGQAINLEAATSSIKTSPTSIVAKHAGTVIWMRYTDLAGGAALPERVKAKLSESIVQAISDESIKLIYKSDILSMRTVRERILAYLSVVSERRANLTIDIGMNQEDLAHYLCVDRSSLSSELNALRREGIIDFKRKVYTLKLK
jgi:CRP-like cAMP-binding protein